MDVKNREALINNFATRCFRDVADFDYIAARSLYKAQLAQQFHWQSLQAIEKYYKAILLYNRIKAKKVGHDLEKATRLCENLPFVMNLSSSTQRFIKHLEKFARFRYLESSYHIEGLKLFELDGAVWEIRRYCKPMNYSMRRSNGSRKNMLQTEINTIDYYSDLYSETPQKFPFFKGKLEEVLSKQEHPARPALVWQNLFFNCSNRQKVTMPSYFCATNSPLDLYPEALKYVEEYVYVPKEIKGRYRGENS